MRKVPDSFEGIKFCCGYYCWDYAPTKSFSAEQLAKSSGICLKCEDLLQAHIDEMIKHYKKK